jgi:hypothetical protein
MRKAKGNTISRNRPKRPKRPTTLVARCCLCDAVRHASVVATNARSKEASRVRHRALWRVAQSVPRRKTKVLPGVWNACVPREQAGFEVVFISVREFSRWWVGVIWEFSQQTSDTVRKGVQKADCSLWPRAFRIDSRTRDHLHLLPRRRGVQ